jgi:hypothetical protein
MGIISRRLEKLVVSGQLKAYTFDHHDDTGSNPYWKLELVFPDGTSIRIIPEGSHPIDGERLGVYGDGYEP